MLDQQASIELESSRSVAISSQSRCINAQSNHHQNQVDANKMIQRLTPNLTERRRQNREALAMAHDIKELTEEDDTVELIDTCEHRPKNLESKDLAEKPE